jgi:hypothetical protein
MSKLSETFIIRETGTPTATAAMYAGSIPPDIHMTVEKLASQLEKKGVPKDMTKAKGIKKAYEDLLKALAGAY